MRKSAPGVSVRKPLADPDKPTNDTQSHRPRNVKCYKTVMWGYEYSSHRLQSVPALTHYETSSISCGVKVKICPSSDGQADGPTFSQNPPQSSLPAQPPLERALYEKVALWLSRPRHVSLNKWPVPKNESRSRPERGRDGRLHHHSSFVLQAHMQAHQLLETK